MAFDRLQQIGEAAEHMRTDRLALIGAGHADDLVGGNAEMVRPEPHQPLDKADIGIGGGVEARFGLVQEELLRQRRLSSASAAAQPALPASDMLGWRSRPLPACVFARAGRVFARRAARPGNRIPRAPLRRLTADRLSVRRRRADRDRPAVRRADRRRWHRSDRPPAQSRIGESKRCRFFVPKHFASDGHEILTRRGAPLARSACVLLWQKLRCEAAKTAVEP